MVAASFILNSAVIDDVELDRIIQSALFFSDAVVVRASHELKDGPSRTAGGVEHQLRELRDAGLVRYWAHEYEVTGPTGLRLPKGRPADLVVSRSSFREKIAETDEYMRSTRERAYRSRADASSLRQGTAEIVGLRDNLNQLVIANELEQSGLLTKRLSRQSFRRPRRVDDSGRSAFSEGVVRDVVSGLEIGSLSALSVEQILSAREHSKDFRKLIDRSVVDVSRGSSTVITAKATAELILQRYRDIVSEYLPQGVQDEVASEMMWDVSGVFVPPTIGLKWAIKSFEWRRQDRAVRPFLLLTQLQRFARM